MRKIAITSILEIRTLLKLQDANYALAQKMIWTRKNVKDFISFNSITNWSITIYLHQLVPFYSLVKEDQLVSHFSELWKTNLFIIHTQNFIYYFKRHKEAIFTFIRFSTMDDEMIHKLYHDLTEFIIGCHKHWPNTFSIKLLI